MKKNRKHLKHICANCWFFSCNGLNYGICVNSDSPSGIRKKNPNDICDGGGTGADDFGFRPCER